ncbi:hypothetical protein [Deinococcus planocerae]|uniref:hypothetical protein n=1 Tax=Deinococcus planocerae TaxID=1737569 RepID=UPI000C7F0949|nr:hypothetical protein [Deinococcus planocerae]
MRARASLLALCLPLAALLAGCGSPTPGGSTPSQPTPDGPPTGAYSCLLLTLNGGLPTYVPSVLGTVTLGAGNTYVAASYPGGGSYTYAAASGRVRFRQGSLDGVQAAFERLEDGAPVLRFGENLGDPAPEMEIGESVCQGNR